MRYIGPVTIEPGYELLYWLPLIRAKGLVAEDITCITRGGAGIWYEQPTINAYETIGFERYQQLWLDRLLKTGMMSRPKDGDIVEREILTKLGVTSEYAPRDLYKLADGVLASFAYQRLPEVKRLHGLPERYIAVKLHRRPDDRHWSDVELEALLKDNLAKECDLPTVWLRPKFQIDDHREIEPIDPGLIVLYEPENSLGIISRVIAHAEKLIVTYGGISYLGPSYGVPTKVWKWGRDRRQPRHQALEERLAEQCNTLYDFSLLTKSTT